MKLPQAPAPAPAAPRQLALRRAQLPVLKLEPLPLTQQQSAGLRLDAVKRVLGAEAAPVQHLRASVLASLATRWALWFIDSQSICLYDHSVGGFSLSHIPLDHRVDVKLVLTQDGGGSD